MTTLTNKIRIELCERKKENPSLSQKQLSKWLEDTHNVSVSQVTISKTLKRSNEILSQPKTINQDAKRQKQTKFPLMETALNEWFQYYQESIPMSGDLIKQKGEFFLKNLYPNEKFEFSNGWLEKFKKRHHIRSFRCFGESGSVDMVSVELALPAIKERLDSFELRDIYNMDETGLNYRMLADHSLASRQLEGRKQGKERVTAVICTNGDGSDKLPLWIIGKFSKPRCFKNINLASLNFKYNANKKAWMTIYLFEEWLKWFDSKMEGRKVLLIMDNCPAHTKPQNLPSLQNTEVFYLPPNTTSKIQPCDAGIIRSFKAYYRRSFHKKLLHDVENGVLDPMKVDILQAIKMCIAAWKDVKAETIFNCFQHCNIRTRPSNTPPATEAMIEEPELVEELNQQMRQFTFDNPMDINFLLNYPSENEIFVLPTEQDILQHMRVEEEPTLADEMDDSEEPQKVPPSEALKMLDLVELSILQQDGNQRDALNKLQSLKDSFKKYHQSTLVQSTLDRYFLSNP